VGRNLLNFALFQAGWFACVLGGVRGEMAWGPIAVAAIVVVHLAVVSRSGERTGELGFIVAVGLAGTLLDTGLRVLEVTAYPTSPEGIFVPPWIAALWFLFATLPYHSLGWLRGRPTLAFLLGAIGGPLSYFGGVRMGAVSTGPEPVWTWLALAVEYAVVTPLMLACVRGTPRKDR